MNNAIERAFDATVDDVDVVKRSVVARINTSNVDRYNTVILAKGANTQGWKKSGSPVLWEHGRSLDRGTLPIANSPRLWNNGGPNPTELIAEPIFLGQDDPFVDKIFRMYRDDHIRGWSVNIIPDLTNAGPPTHEELRSRPDWEGADVVYRNWQMVEFSGTVCPGNADAVTAERAGRTLEAVQRSGVWLPEEARLAYQSALDRSLTGQAGGLAKGGGLVDDDRKRRRKDEADDDDDDDDDDDEGPKAKKKQREDNDHGADCDTRSDGDGIVRKIVEEGGKFYVYSEDGTKKLGGPYSSRGEAEHRLAQVEYFKHREKDGGRALLVGARPLLEIMRANQIAEAELIRALRDDVKMWLDLYLYGRV